MSLDRQCELAQPTSLLLDLWASHTHSRPGIPAYANGIGPGTGIWGYDGYKGDPPAPVLNHETGNYMTYPRVEEQIRQEF